MNFSLAKSSPPQEPEEDRNQFASAMKNTSAAEEDYDFEGTGNEVNEPGGGGFLLSRKKLKKGMVGSAAVAGGVTGLVVAGPVVGIVGAVGAGALATQNNKAGEVARASGGVVMAAGDRAKEIDEKHNVFQKVKHVTDSIVQATRKWNREHKVTDKILLGIMQGLKFISGKLQPQQKLITNGENTKKH